MNKAYVYSGTTGSGNEIKGSIFAESRFIALSQLKKNGIKVSSIDLEPIKTISGLFGTSISKKALANFYNTLGKSLQKGRSIDKALESTLEYVSDDNLKQAILVTQSKIESGRNIDEAMGAAGFPKRDVMLISSTMLAGKTATTFISLAEEIRVNEELSKSVKNTLMMPAILGGIAVIFLLCVFIFIAPNVVAFFNKTGAKMAQSGFYAAYFDFIKFFNENVIVNSTIYIAFFVGVFFALRSKFVGNIFDRIPTIKRLSVKSDHAAIWRSFSLLYEASIPGNEGALIVSQAASREDTRKSMTLLSKHLAAGLNFPDAIKKSNFPLFIEKKLISATATGEYKDGLDEMVVDLKDEVEGTINIIKQLMPMMSTIILGGFILLVFVLSYLPILTTIGKNL